LVGKPKRKKPLGKPRDTWENIKLDLKKQDGRVWAGFIWLRTGTSSKLL
jgi:hypothetical protein